MCFLSMPEKSRGCDSAVCRSHGQKGLLGERPLGVIRGQQEGLSDALYGLAVTISWVRRAFFFLLISQFMWPRDRSP